MMGPPQGYWGGAWRRGLSPVQKPWWCWGLVPSLVSECSRRLSDCEELPKARTKEGRALHRPRRGASVTDAFCGANSHEEVSRFGPK